MELKIDFDNSIIVYNYTPEQNKQLYFLYIEVLKISQVEVFLYKYNMGNV